MVHVSSTTHEFKTSLQDSTFGKELQNNFNIVTSYEDSIICIHEVVLMREMSCELGTLTREQFNEEITTFVEKSENLGENWHVRQHETAAECKYLVKRETIPRTGHFKESQVHGEDVENFPNELIDSDHAASAEDAVWKSEACANFPKEATEIVTFEYHIVYSPSYSVPVLYFSAWTQDGKLLSLNEIWDHVSQIHQHFLHYDKWSFITQQEHPLLQRPFFLVHPCHTADFMKLLKKDTQTADAQKVLQPYMPRKRRLAFVNVFL